MGKLHASQSLKITVKNQETTDVTTPLAFAVDDKNKQPSPTLDVLKDDIAPLRDYNVGTSPDGISLLPGLANHKNQVTVTVGFNPKAHSTVAGHAQTACELIAHREALRQAAGAITRNVIHLNEITIAFADIHGNLIGSDEDVIAVAEGAALGLYNFDPYKNKKSRENFPKTELTAINILTTAEDTPALNQKIERAQTIADAVGHARDLVNHPPNILNPDTFAQHVVDTTSGLPLKVAIWEEKKLAKEGCHNLLAVGQGSTHPSRLVKIEYLPSKASTHVALVGKGITFDSGGLSLKPPASMTTMKADMAGAAAVLATIIAAATIKTSTAVTAWLCLAENMPSRHAQRPGDIYTAKNGTSVEVLNTDAEGRLVLADGLCAASEENPDVILDVATLTGAQRVALGPTVSAVMGDDDTRRRLKEAADIAGEKFWCMPLPEELRATLNSDVADIANVGNKGGGMLTAGLFLREFVGTCERTEQKIPWAHLDIAGPSYNEAKPWGYTPRGGTGVGVRTLIKYITTLETDE